MQKPKIYHLEDLMDAVDRTDSTRYPNDWTWAVCEAIAQTAISPATRVRWRGLIDVVENRRYLTKGQALCLMAIAYLKRGNLKARVTEQDIRRCLTGDRLAVMNQYLSGEIEIGLQGWRDVSRAIGNILGRRPSRATLYRRIPGFSSSKVYYHSDIDRFCSLLSRHETEISA